MALKRKFVLHEDDDDFEAWTASALEEEGGSKRPRSRAKGPAQPEAGAQAAKKKRKKKAAAPGADIRSFFRAPKENKEPVSFELPFFLFKSSKGEAAAAVAAAVEAEGEGEEKVARTAVTVSALEGDVQADGGQPGSGRAGTYAEDEIEDDDDDDGAFLPRAKRPPRQSKMSAFIKQE